MHSVGCNSHYAAVKFYSLFWFVNPYLDHTCSQTIVFLQMFFFLTEYFRLILNLQRSETGILGCRDTNMTKLEKHWQTVPLQMGTDILQRLRS